MTALEGKALLDHGKAIAKRYSGRVGSDMAEELGAEAVLRALRSPPPDGRLEPWLERIYRNLVVDLWRSRRSATLDIADVRGLAVAGTPEDAVLVNERRRRVRSSVALLPREARRALLARYYAEYDDNVSATRLGIAGPTMRTRIHRALDRLRVRLGDLRGLLPPVFGKVGGHVGAMALAPVMFAALVAISVSPRAPEAELPQSVVPEPQVALTAKFFVPPTTRTASRAAVPTPRKRAHAVSRTSDVSSPVRESIAQIGPFAEREEVVADIQLPESLDVFADPEAAARPCLVEAPPSFLAQLEKMVEESL